MKRAFLAVARRAFARRFSRCARLAVVAATGIACAAAFASGAVPPDLDLLDRYLDRADGMDRENDWLAASGEASEAVMAKWDAQARAIFEAGIDLASLRVQAGKEVAAEIERRLGDWLLGRFVGTVGGVDWVATLDAIGATKLAGIFELDDAGRVTVDAAGDPARKPVAGDAGFTAELESWKTAARAIAEKAVAEWETRATGALGELLSGMDEGRRAELGRTGRFLLDELGAGKRRELDTLLALEESDYRHYRLTDQASLRLESEGEDASAVVAALIGETNASLEATLSELANALDEEAGAVTGDGEVIDGDAWQSEFRAALENGLALWARSGEEFLARRIEWERKAGVDLADGIERWNDALREMQDKEGAWLEELKSVRERAEARFDRRFEELEAARVAAMSELDESIAANEGNLAERVETMVGMLERSLGMMNTAREGAEYWIGAFSGNGEYSLDGISWDANAMRAELFRVAEHKLRPNRLSTLMGTIDLSDVSGRKPYTENLLASIERMALGKVCETERLSPAERAALIANGLSRGLLKDGAGYATLVEEYWQTVLNEQASEAFDKYMDKDVSDTISGSDFTGDALYGELKDVGDGKTFKEVLSAERIAALRADFLARITETMKSTLSLSAASRESLSQAGYWIETVYARYEAEAEAQNEALTESYGLVVFEGKRVPEGGYGSDRTIAGPIKELLDEYGWEGLYLDDYQVELLKARAVSAYWQKELAVAEAVREYAVTNDYTRETEAETLERYNASLDSYSRALEDYRVSVRDLEAVNDAIDEKNAAIARIRERLETQKGLLADQKRIYSALILSSSLDSTEYYTGQFRSYYEALARLRASDSKEGSVARAGKALADAASARDADALVAASSEAIAALIDGDPLRGPDDKGIVALRAEYDARASFTADALSYESRSAFLEKAATALLIDESDATYAILESAYERYAAASDSSAAAERLAATLETVASTLALESAGAIERKMMAIRLLLAESEQEAFDAIKTVAPDSITARSIDGCAGELAERARYAERSLFGRRLEIESEALAVLVAAMDEYRTVDGHGNSAEGFAYAKPSGDGYTASRLAWTLDRLLAEGVKIVDGEARVSELTGDERLARVRETLSALEMIKSILIDAALTEVERTEKLRALAAGNAMVRTYLAGGSVFASEGVDYAIPALADEYRERVALSGASDTYESFARLSPALSAARRASAIEALSDWLSANGLGYADAGTITLANAETIWKNFSPASRADAIGKIAGISKGARDILDSGDIPTSVAEGLDSWVRELENLLAAKALRDFPGDTGGGAVASGDEEAVPETIRTRVLAAFDSVIKNHDGAWRACLGREGFITNADDAAKIDGTEMDFVAARKVSEVTSESDGIARYYSDNALVNDGLESAARLAALGATLGKLVSSWSGIDALEAAKERLESSPALKAANPLDASFPGAFSAYEAGSRSVELEIVYQNARNEHAAGIARLSMNAETLASLGETVRVFEESKGKQLAESTASTKTKIAEIEKAIDAIEKEWKEAIDDPATASEVASGNFNDAGYRQLEEAYAARYSAAGIAFKRLEEEKHGLKVAKAVYEYASTPYLRVSDEADSGKTVMPTSGKHSAVDPDTRFAEVLSRSRCADAAVDALEELYGNKNKEQCKSLYERDAKYRALKDNYETMYRGKLAAAQAQCLLDTEIARAKARYERAKVAYEDSIISTSSAPVKFEESGDKSVSGWIAGLRDELESGTAQRIFDSLRIVNGTVSFSGEGTLDENAVADYFTRKDGEPYSAFELELAKWLEQNGDKVESMSKWSYALSWEEISLSGGYQSWQEYYTAAEDYMLAHENNPYFISAFYLDTSSLRNSYSSQLGALLGKTLLAGHGGAGRDEDLETAVYATADKVDWLFSKIKDSYAAVKDTKDYTFFKLVSLYRLYAGNQAESPLRFLHGSFATGFYSKAHDVCQSNGTDSWFDKPAWHNARDIAVEKRDNARRAVQNTHAAMTTTKTGITIRKNDYDASKAAYTTLLGGDSESGGSSVTFEELLTAIVTASGNSAAKPLDDILRLAGYAIDTKTSETTKREYLRKTLTANGTIDVPKTSRTVSTYLDSIVASYGARISEAQTKLDTYLYSDGAGGGDDKKGIAILQEERERELREAYARFVAVGIIPDEHADLAIVSKWESVLEVAARNPEGDSASVAAQAGTFLAAIKDETDVSPAVVRLRDAWTGWLAAKKGTSEEKLAGNELATAFTVVVAGYRAGLDWKSALTAAYDRTGETATSGHVFDSREDSLRTYDLYSDILGDLQSEKSHVREVGREEVTASLRDALAAINANRLAAYMAVRASRWDVLTAELTGEREQFDAQMDAIASRGKTAWNRAVDSLTSAAKAWQTSFERNYERKSAAWETRYLAFIERKNQWATDLACQALSLGDKAILDRIPTLTGDAIREASDFIVADVVEAPDPDALIASVLDQDLLSTLLESAKRSSSSVASFSPAVFQTLRRDTRNGARILERVREWQTSEDDELEARLAFLQYSKAIDTLKEARGEVEKSLDDSNEDTWRGFRNMFLDSGFRQTGDNFTKKTTVGATLMDNLYETHTIKGYERFKTEIKDFTRDFAAPEGIAWADIGPEGMNALLQQALEAVPKEYNRLYGERDKDGNLLGATYERQFQKNERHAETRSRYDEATRRYVTYLVEKTKKINAAENVNLDAYKKYIEDSEEPGSTERVIIKKSGEFVDWVGYAPVMKDDADPTLDLGDWKRNVKYEGAGQTGEIMGFFIQHRMIESVGKAEARQPFYSRRLWDDRGSWMAAPTIRSVVDMAMTIVATAVAPGPGALALNTALNTVDDAVFTMMDVSNGMDPLAAAEGLVKKAATSYATAKINLGFNGFTDGGVVHPGLLQKLGLQGNVVGSTLLKGAEVMTTNIASSGMNAFSVSSMFDGGPLFDTDAFVEGSFGTNAMASVMSGMAGTYVSGKLNELNLGKDAIKVNGFNTGQIKDVGGIGTLVGGVSGSAVTYGVTGNATLNLARINGVGIMEMHLGNDGFGMNFGMNGTDMSLGSLYGAVKGLQHLEKNKKIEAAAKDNRMDVATALRSQYGFGDRMALEQLDGVLSGTTILRDGTGLPERARGETTTENGKRVVYLAGYHEAMTTEEQLTMGITLQHEAYRDGIASGNNMTETQLATYAHTLIAERMTYDPRYAALMGNLISRDSTLATDLAMLNKSREHHDGSYFASYVDSTYDSSKDYWRVTKDKDGKVIKVQDDGDKTHITFVDDNGNQQGDTTQTSGSLSLQIAKLAKSGQTKSEINDIMVASGLDWNNQSGWFSSSDSGQYYQPWGSLSGNMFGLLNTTSSNIVDRIKAQMLQEKREPNIEKMNESEKVEYYQEQLTLSDRMVSNPVETNFALTQLGLVGEDYVYGSENPYNNNESGVDCSGGPQFGLRLQGYILPSRETAAGFISKYCAKVTDGTRYPGDVRALYEGTDISHIQTLVDQNARVNPTGVKANTIRNPGTVNLYTSQLPSSGAIFRLNLERLEQYYDSSLNVVGGRLNPSQLDRAWEKLLRWENALQ